MARKSILVFMLLFTGVLAQQQDHFYSRRAGYGFRIPPGWSVSEEQRRRIARRGEAPDVVLSKGKDEQLFIWYRDNPDKGSIDDWLRVRGRLGLVAPEIDGQPTRVSKLKSGETQYFIAHPRGKVIHTHCSPGAEKILDSLRFEVLPEDLAINGIRLGMTRAEVVGRLGEPTGGEKLMPDGTLRLRFYARLVFFERDEAAEWRVSSTYDDEVSLGHGRRLESGTSMKKAREALQSLGEPETQANGALIYKCGLYVGAEHWWVSGFGLDTKWR